MTSTPSTSVRAPPVPHRASIQPLATRFGLAGLSSRARSAAPPLPSQPPPSAYYTTHPPSPPRPAARWAGSRHAAERGAQRRAALRRHGARFAPRRSRAPRMGLMADAHGVAHGSWGGSCSGWLTSCLMALLPDAARGSWRSCSWRSCSWRPWLMVLLADGARGSASCPCLMAPLPAGSSWGTWAVRAVAAYRARFPKVPRLCRLACPARVLQ
jgi:hypothetical protein